MHDDLPCFDNAALRRGRPSVARRVPASRSRCSRETR
ncbi:hypothetical protein ACRAWF_01885 [Streptomyces sp. L7]